MLDTTLLDKIIVGRVEPHIYAFSTNTIPNYLKIGDTYRPVFERLKEWRVYFPDLIKHFDARAMINDDVYFRDFSVHQYVEREKARVRLKFNDIDDNIYFSREFFKEATAQDVKEAISDIEKDYSDHTNKYQFYNAETLSPVNTKFQRTETYELRPNQKETVNAFKTAIANGRKNLLMYAVMRFGKSFTSMCCAVEMGAKVVVVVSAKADVLIEWKKTVESHVKFSDYEFLTEKSLKRNEHVITDTLNEGKRVVVFLTLQDLQGKTIKGKHQEVFGQDIDLLLVDETHFGARAEKFGLVLKNTNKYEQDKRNKQDNDDFVDIDTANKTIKTLKAKVTVHLSGTPYRILMGSEFKKEDIISFYQFTDIVEDQKNWDNERILDDSYKEWDNPYYGFPQMVRFAFCPNESSRKRLEELKKSGTTYAFSALFKPKSIKKSSDGSHKKFIYEKEILDLLEVIDGSKSDDELLGFLDYERLKEGQMCRHIVIALPYRASCDALEELIKNNRDKFRNLSAYEIVNISGVESPEAYKSPEVIKGAITQYEFNGQKTITLTVNRMLTGSTVPEWDTMIYLNDTASPQEYDQAIFRLQNQYIKTCVDDKGDRIKINLKPQTLLVDFDPNRMFAMQEQKSKIFNVNTDIGGNSELKRRMDLELRFSPIIVINSRKVEQVCATDIMQAISNYKLDKGIREEAIEIPVDLGILEEPIIRAAIDGENEIGSGKGIALPAHNPSQESGDGEPETTGGKGTSDKPESPENTEEGERSNVNEGKEGGNAIETVLKKKIQSHYARLLLFAFLTKDRVISLADIIDKFDKEENSRIAGNLGLDKSVLKLIESKINKFVLSELDYKIQDINELSHDTQKSPAQKVTIAIQKFGKLGDAIVTTPSNICDDMIDLLPQDFIESLPAKGGKILDLAGTSGEYAVALHKRMTEAGLDKGYIANAIYTIPKSTICYELVRKIYEMLGLNTQNIAKNFNAFDLLTIKQGKKVDYERINDILKQDKPFEEITLQDEVKEGDKKVKFDAIVGNPPYQEEKIQISNKSNAQNPRTNVFHYFQLVAMQLTAKYTSLIFPAIRWIHQSGKGLKKFGKDLINSNALTKIHFYPNSKELFPGIDIPDGLSIILTDKNKDIAGFEYVYCMKDEHFAVQMDNPGDELLTINPNHINITKKIKLFVEEQKIEFLHDNILPRSLFGIESDFIEKNSSIAEPYNPSKKVDYTKFVKVLTNDKAGPAGRSAWFILPKEVIKESREYIDQWQVVVSSAHAGGQEGRDNQLAIIDNHSAFGRARVALKSFVSEEEAVNFAKYVQCNMIKYAFLLTDEALSSLGKYVPDILNYRSNNGIIDFDSNIDSQLYKLMKITDEEIAFIKSMIKPME